MTLAKTLSQAEARGPEPHASPRSIETGASIFETIQAEPIDKVTALRRMSAISSRPPFALAKELFTLSRGVGRLSLRDYVDYRLFDDAYVGGADKSIFIGRSRNQQINAEINYRHEWNCLSDDKIAHAGYLTSYGLPVVPTAAIYAPHLGRSTASLLRTPAELRAFLADPAHYPMFGKPTDGVRSLGSIALERLDAKAGMIETSRSTISIDALVDTIETTFKEGYLFQPQLSNHTAIVPAIGTGLSTARVVTIATDDGPRLFAAAWKIIGGTNIADNYWRPGNILAAFDPVTGRITRAVTGLGFDMREVTHHPTTQAVLADVTLPLCEAVINVAIEGHRTLRHLGIIGWDIGITDQGPVIVETNVMPDLLLLQVANRTGAFNPAMAALLERQRAAAKAHHQAMKATVIVN